MLASRWQICFYDFLKFTDVAEVLAKCVSPSLAMGVAVAPCGYSSVCLCCGFHSPHLESWLLLMRFICSKLMKGESVKAEVFVKPFLKPQAGDLLTLGKATWGGCREGKGNLPVTSLSSWEEWQCPSWNECWVAGLKQWKEFSQGIEGEQEKVLFHVTSYKWVQCLFCARVQSWVSASRPESSPQAHWNGNGFARCSGMQIILGMFLGLVAF